ncbi:MAG: methyltransferase domain-containing protein [Prevotella sp.]|nr:methyltransferase domain-containing protein [Prevotella sp.]
MANDYFQFKQFTVWQQHCAMKVGTDGTLLGAWARGGNHILDVGTGTGLIALMMAQRFAQAHIVGIDIDAEAAAQASSNVEASPFASRITILQQDFANPLTSHLSPLTSHLSPLPSNFDAIVSNPPYFTDALPSPDARRTLARHATTLPFSVLMQRSWQLLSDQGELSLVIPADGRSLVESEAVLAGFFKCRECAVRTSPRKPAKRLLLAFAKHPRGMERTELTIGSDAYTELTKDFYL